MSKSQIATFAALALAAAAPAAEAQFAYQPTTQRYRLEQTLAATQEMGGQKQEQTVSTTQVLGLTLRPGAGDALAFTFTIDSVNVTSPMAAAQMQAQTAAQQLVGKSVTGLVSKRGAIRSIQAPPVPGDSTGGQLASGFRNFFVQFPAGAVRQGMKWTDTTTTPINNGGIEGTSTAIMTYTVEGDTTVAGRQAWRIASTGTVTTSGMGNAQGQELALSGNGTLAGTSVVSKDGVYLGSDSRMNQALTVQVVAMNMSIPVTQEITNRVRLVP